MRRGVEDKKLMTAGDVARYCQVTQRAVAKWVEQNKLKAYRTPGGRIRVQKEDFMAFLKTYSMSVPEELLTSTDQPRILIVDDEKNIINSLKRLLQQADNEYVCDGACNGFEAGIKIGTFKPHVIILDIKMPGLDGYDVIRMINENPLIHPKIIVYSGVLPEELRSEILRLGVDECFPKTVDTQVLIDTVERLAKMR